MKHFQKHVLIAMLILGIYSCNNNAEVKSGSLKDSTTIQQQTPSEQKDSASSNKESGDNKAILDIRAEYERINGIKLSTKKYAFECEASPGEGELVYYTENNKVVKVYINWGVAGDFLRTSEYYYKDGKLFFIYETINGGAANEPQRTDEERTYIVNDKTIRYMENKKIVPCKNCEFNEKSLAYKIYKAYNTHSATKVVCE